MLWYPATGQEQSFDYHGQKGYAIEDAPAAPGEHPLIVFSHGFLGAADQVIYLTEALARDGYIVVAVNHADAINERREKPLAWPNFVNGNSWDETRHQDRREDLAALLDDLLKANTDQDSFLYHHIDKKAIGAMGHSLGGYTVLGMIGGWPSWKDNRIRAALLLSPYTLPYQKGGRLQTIDRPVMLQGATLDLGITPFLQDVYNKLPGPKYYLVLKKETHFAWTNFISLGKTTKEIVEQGNAKLITDYSRAFFQKHLRDSETPILKARAPALESYQYQIKAKR